MREYFCEYHSMLDATRKLSDAEVGRLFRGLLQYSATGEQPHNLQGREEIVFDIFSQQIDRQKERYDSKCKQLQANGSKSHQKQANRVQEKEKEEDKEKDKDNHDDDDTRARVNTVAVYAANNLQHMSAGNIDELAGFQEILPDDVIRFAIDKACGNGAPRWAYTASILQSYVRDGIKTVGDAKAAQEKHEQGKRSTPQKDNPALHYEQRTYDDHYGDNLFIDLDKYSEGSVRS